MLEDLNLRSQQPKVVKYLRCLILSKLLSKGFTASPKGPGLAGLVFFFQSTA